jgi:hypothetical protein
MCTSENISFTNTVQYTFQILVLSVCFFANTIKRLKFYVLLSVWFAVWAYTATAAARSERVLLLSCRMA